MPNGAPTGSAVSTYHSPKDMMKSIGTGPTDGESRMGPRDGSAHDYRVTAPHSQWSRSHATTASQRSFRGSIRFWNSGSAICFATASASSTGIGPRFSC
jgi:hypothetical protein